MPTYVSLSSWTEQGIKAIKDSPARLDAARALAKKYGCDFKDFYMVMGEADMVAIVEAPDDEAMAKFGLALAMSGSVRTKTMKAFTEAEYRKITSGV